MPAAFHNLIINPEVSHVASRHHLLSWVHTAEACYSTQVVEQEVAQHRERKQRWTGPFPCPRLSLTKQEPDAATFLFPPATAPTLRCESHRRSCYRSRSAVGLFRDIKHHLSKVRASTQNLRLQTEQAVLQMFGTHAKQSLDASTLERQRKIEGHRPMARSASIDKSLGKLPQRLAH